MPSVCKITSVVNRKVVRQRSDIAIWKRNPLLLWSPLGLNLNSTKLIHGDANYYSARRMEPTKETR